MISQGFAVEGLTAVVPTLTRAGIDDTETYGIRNGQGSIHEPVKPCWRPGISVATEEDACPYVIVFL